MLFISHSNPDENNIWDYLAVETSHFLFLQNFWQVFHMFVFIFQFTDHSVSHDKPNEHGATVRSFNQIENKQFSKTNLMSVILRPLILRKRGSLSSGAEGGRWVTFQATDKPKPWKIHSILPAFFVSYVRLSLHCPLIICPLPLTRWKSISLPCSFIHAALVAPVPSVTW